MPGSPAPDRYWRYVRVYLSCQSSVLGLGASAWNPTLEPTRSHSHLTNLQGITLRGSSLVVSDRRGFRNRGYYLAADGLKIYLPLRRVTVRPWKNRLCCGRNRKAIYG